MLSVSDTVCAETEMAVTAKAMNVNSVFIPADYLSMNIFPM